MAVGGWILDKSLRARLHQRPISLQVDEVSEQLYLCRVGELEQLYSARSAAEYDDVQRLLEAEYPLAEAPEDLLARALTLQRDVAHHHGMWHRIPIPDLLIAETALYHGFGVLHVDSDFGRIARVRPLVEHQLS